MAVERYCLEHGREKRTRIYLSMNCTLRLLASLDAISGTGTTNLDSHITLSYRHASQSTRKNMLD